MTSCHGLFCCAATLHFCVYDGLGGYAYRHIAMQHERRTSVHVLQSGSLWTWITQWC
ncbi:hypothetical protein XFF6990_390068 [Xanthomonas citri pv. fuscans]|uniref:Uncharacterized protein n=1 Tax=Xanthomonas campestris pv. phaseoli TaxID=317013 RepID=A0A7Z7NG60_XANCH|nr:hypothetical protein XFF6990_390068 [Xanthomonas citri pv. fuscans]SOO23532.1 hypothetical protein XFF6991_280191 [Xanthomonas phaseoli pv. phaseoli]